MSLQVSCKGGRMDISVEFPTRNPPRQTRVHIRRPETVRKVFLNGRPVSRTELAASVVVVPAAGHQHPTGQRR